MGGERVKKKLRMYNLKRHPFVFAIAAWVYVFFCFGYFSTDGVLTVNYLVPAVIAGIGAYLHFAKRERIKKVPEKKRKAPLWALGAVLLTVIMVWCFGHTPTDDFIRGRNSCIPPAFLLGGLFCYSIFITVKKKWSVGRILLCIFLLSLFIHVFYILTAKLKIAQWDMGTISGNKEGHLGYIRYLYDNFLPAQFDPREKWQYYHPPLHYIITALVLRVQSLLGIDITVSIYNVQFLSSLYAVLCAVTACCIARELHLRNLPLIISFSIIALSPAFFYVGGFVNNDMLSVLFSMLCVLYTIKWYKNQKARNILKIALFFGLGMLSKMSVALLALPIGVVFIFALYKSLRSAGHKGFGRLVGQMFAFLGVAAPMSLYWSLRNLIRFGVPIGYIPDSIIEEQFIPQGTAQRLFDFFSLEQYTNPYYNALEYGDALNEYNPIICIIKSSASDVGTGRSIIGFVPGFIMFWSTFLLALAGFVMMIYILIKKKSMEGIFKAFFAVMYVTLIGSYCTFCIKYPYACTAQVRYVMLTILIGALFIGICLKRLRSGKSRVCGAITRSVGWMTYVFGLCSVCIMCIIGTNLTINWMLS